jgi:hypothetical protein
VAERQDELDRQREQRQAGSQPDMRSKPAHRYAAKPFPPAAGGRPLMLFYNMATSRHRCQERWERRSSVLSEMCPRGHA